MNRFSAPVAASWLVAMSLAVSGCANPWPARATGGLAERDRPYAAIHARAAEVILENRSNGRMAPGRLSLAEDHLVVAIRERAAGLCQDAKENTFAVSQALGGIRRERQFETQDERDEPCAGLAGEYQ